MTEISNIHFLSVKGSPMMAELAEKDLERRLSLYQVFLKLYEHHSSLLDEILRLENLYQPSFTGVKVRYIQGVIDDSVVYVTTNLCEGKTQSLRQSQQIWTIGRDRTCGINISDRHLSRHHAAIQYNIDHQCFYLFDLNSTNGSYVNGEPVYQPIKLHDGDRIRLGSMTFSFFLNNTSLALPTVPAELLMQLMPHRIAGNEVEISTSSVTRKLSLVEKQDDTAAIFQDLSLMDEEPAETFTKQQFSLDQQSEILDRFLNRHTSENPS